MAQHDLALTEAFELLRSVGYHTYFYLIFSEAQRSSPTQKEMRMLKNSQHKVGGGSWMSPPENVFENLDVIWCILAIFST